LTRKIERRNLNRELKSTSLGSQPHTFTIRSLKNVAVVLETGNRDVLLSQQMSTSHVDSFVSSARQRTGAPTVAQCCHNETLGDNLRSENTRKVFQRRHGVLKTDINACACWLTVGLSPTLINQSRRTQDYVGGYEMSMPRPT